MLRQSQAAKNLLDSGFPKKEPITDCMKAAARLIQATANGNDNSEEHVSRQLIMLAKSAPSVLSEAILKSDDNGRINASLLISKLTDESVVSILQALTDDSNLYVRWNATAGLRRLGAIDQFQGPYQR